GSRTTLPGGDIAYTGDAAVAPSSHAVIDAAIADAVPGARVLAVEEPGTLPQSGEITTVVSPHPGGAVVSVYSVTGAPGATELVARASVTTIDSVAAAAGGDGAADSAAPASAAAGAPAGFGAAERTPAAPGMPTAGGAVGGSAEPGWSPDSGVPVESHLRTIVGEAMGYDVDDLPLELPLINLGLDSLMGMLIKNRVEHDFSIPPLQVQALRDASVADVIMLVGNVAEEALGALGSGDDAAAGASAASAAAPTDSADASGAGPSHMGAEISGTDADPAVGTRGGERTGMRVAPRDASERTVFGTWATVSGAAAHGVTDPLPELPDDLASALAERLGE